MRLQVTINSDNQAMEDASEWARLLRQVANRLEENGFEVSRSVGRSIRGVLLDINGNSVGKYAFNPRRNKKEN